MKVADYQQCYYDMSGRASDIARSLSLGGLGVIWIFKLDDPEGVQLAAALVQAAGLIIVSMALDLLQYLYLSITWLIVGYVYEKKYGHDAENLSHSRWLPRIGEIIFFLKMIALCWGYALIASYVWQRLHVI